MLYIHHHSILILLGWCARVYQSLDQLLLKKKIQELMVYVMTRKLALAEFALSLWSHIRKMSTLRKVSGL